MIQNGGFELNGGGDPGLDHWNKRGCQISAEQWDVHQGEKTSAGWRSNNSKAKTLLYSDFWNNKLELQKTISGEHSAHVSRRQAEWAGVDFQKKVQ